MLTRLPAMKRLLLLLFVLAGAAAVLWLWPIPVSTTPPTPNPDPEGRVESARARCEESVAEYFRQAGVPVPARELFLRAFKHEAVLEVWARGDEAEFKLIRTYPITYSSGRPGPKRREGDRQVPEGFYQIEGFNPLSLYHLSLRVNYPNASDRVLSDREKPGFDIYVHGGDGSVGCLPLGDAGIEEVYLMALDAGNHDAIPLHIFPARMAGPEWETFVAPFRDSAPALVRFWENLRPGFNAFERTRRLPRIAVAGDGSYRVESD
jgi:murein L,D-transpeptidase YafK